MSYVEGHRHATVTINDHGAILEIVACFLTVVIVLATSLRLSLRIFTRHVAGLDDALVLLATVS